MKFTFKEWQAIRHSLVVAKNQYENHMSESKPSDEHTSMFQIFKRQVEEIAVFLDRIDNVGL